MWLWYVIQYAGAASRVLMKQSWRLNLDDKKHMLADEEVCCATVLFGSIVPSHCWIRDRVVLPPVLQAQSLGNSVPYHINIFMNVDDGSWGCDVQFCGERICYHVLIYRVIQEERSQYRTIPYNTSLLLLLSGLSPGYMFRYEVPSSGLSIKTS
jgi:hypothetical protein